MHDDLGVLVLFEILIYLHLQFVKQSPDKS